MNKKLIYFGAGDDSLYLNLDETIWNEAICVDILPKGEEIAALDGQEFIERLFNNYNRHNFRIADIRNDTLTFKNNKTNQTIRYFLNVNFHMEFSNELKQAIHNWDTLVEIGTENPYSVMNYAHPDKKLTHISSSTTFYDENSLLKKEEYWHAKIFIQTEDCECYNDCIACDKCDSYSEKFKYYIYI